MTSCDDASITQLLGDMQRGVPGSDEKVFGALYSRLRAMAASVRAHKGRGATVDASDLVNEVYLRVIRRESPWADRKHFMNWAAVAMERMLIDRARARKARHKREGRSGTQAEAAATDLGVLDEHIERLEQSAGPLERLEPALQKLAEHHPDACAVVRLNYWCSLKPSEIAPLLDMSKRTACRKLAYGKLLIKGELA